MVKGVRELLITESLTSSHCYVKCFDSSNHGKRFCSASAKDARYCPTADIGCDTKCFTTRATDNKEVELVGAKHLSQDSLTLQDITKYSYEYYKRHGNSHLTSTNISDPVTGLKSQSEVSRISLPVCMSKQIDYTKAGGKTPNFPAMCGDWSGNETEAFLSRIGFGKDDRDVKSNMAEELKVKIGKHHLLTFHFSSIQKIRPHPVPRVPGILTASSPRCLEGFGTSHELPWPLPERNAIPRRE